MATGQELREPTLGEGNGGDADVRPRGLVFRCDMLQKEVMVPDKTKHGAFVRRWRTMSCADMDDYEALVRQQVDWSQVRSKEADEYFKIPCFGLKVCGRGFPPDNLSSLCFSSKWNERDLHIQSARKRPQDHSISFVGRLPFPKVLARIS